VVVPTPTAIGNSYLLDISKDKLQTIRISDQQNKTTLLERDNTGMWKIGLPMAGETDQAAAEAAETQIGALLIVTNIDAPPPLADMGLDSPPFIIQLSTLSGVHHTIEVGNKTPTGSGYYVRFDEKTISVVGADGIESLTKLISNPPFAATQTPAYTLTSTNNFELETTTPTATP
jgi:hypothetical protein